MTTPQIIAHRGASYLAPENTLVAFRKAMEIGADGVEMDVQKTYDNELVIHHDYMVDMHTDISGQIYDLTMGELKTLDFGSWKMPSTPTRGSPRCRKRWSSAPAWRAPRCSWN